MEYKLDNRIIRINESSLKLLGSGSEGKTYRYKNQALKIKENSRIGLSLEDAKYMTSIRTTNILLPRSILYQNNHYSGYTTKYIRKNNNFRLIDIPKEKLINHILLPLEEDIETISNKDILLGDLSVENIITNDTIYITDPGSYIRITDIDKINLKYLNQLELNELLKNLIIFELKRNKQYSQAIIMFKNQKATIKDNPSNYYDELLPRNTSIKELVKRISVY